MTYLTGHASPHFTWAELGVTSATRTVHRDAMGVLASTILEPIRAHVGGPVRVNRPDLGLLGRGWRASQGIGSATSQHLVGQAVDLDIDGDLVAAQKRDRPRRVVAGQLGLRDRPQAEGRQTIQQQATFSAEGAVSGEAGESSNGDQAGWHLLQDDAGMVGHRLARDG